MKIVDALPLVTSDQLEVILAAPRTTLAHQALLKTLPAMNAVQVGREVAEKLLPAEMSIAAWNVERGLFPEQNADLLASLMPDVVLLSEVDHGMARTAQRHTAQEMADELGMTYAFGVEFHELDLGGTTELPFCSDDFNERGWHGNAILSAVPFEAVTMVRLDDHGHWFASDELDADPQQPRVGGRMALMAIVPRENGPVCVVSTHLESNADGKHRALQFDRLMDAIDVFAPDMPVMIGGDLNTGNHQPPDFDWRREPLFERAGLRGYHWDATPEGNTTRRSLITPHPTREMKLDWFFTRGLSCVQHALVSALGPDDLPLSDHDVIWCSVS
ncbi:endonuclease/exonuclease/phosphatase family protein [Yoonia sp. MH D7]